MRLQGKVVLVTGAASGIGHAVAELFAKEGATVFASDIASGGMTLDVTSEDDWRKAVDTVTRKSGRLDVLINNAGIIAYEPLHELDMKAWLRMIAVDQTGVFLGMREAVRVMRRQKSGSIVNISSIWGSAAVAGAHAYHAAKGAVRNMSKNAAMTYVADGIRVNSVHPGFIHTPLTDSQAPALNERRDRGDADEARRHADRSRLRLPVSRLRRVQLRHRRGAGDRWRLPGAVAAMKSSSQTVIGLPADRIDLRAWLAILSDRDYQACSPAHRAAGVFHEDGVFGSINVESVGGHLLVHHYLSEHASARRVVMHSRNTRVYVMHTVPATIEVIWTLEIEPQDNKSSQFRCSVEVRLPALLTLLGTLTFLHSFLRWHVQGETPLFAADLARKVADGRLAPP